MQLAVDGLALHYGPVPLVGDHEIGTRDRLALAPAFGDAGHGLVPARLPLGDEVADHADRNHQDERQRAHEDSL